MAVSLTSSGLAMPASQSASGDANTLDDYEEGTWTPNILGSSGTAGTWGNIGREGDYIKTGSMVYFAFYAYVNNVGSYSGNLRVNGLPFAGTGMGNVTAITVAAHLLNDAGMVTGGVTGGQSYMHFSTGAYQETATPWSSVVTGRSFSLAGCYNV